MGIPNEEVQAAVRTIATEMLPQFSDIAAAQTRFLVENIPDARREGIEDIILQLSSANTALVLGLMARGVSVDTYTASPDVIQLTHALVQRGQPLTSVIRGHHLGANLLVERWAEAVQSHMTGDERSVAVVRVGTSCILEGLDLMTERLSEEYRNEDERLARERTLSRLDAVRAVLSDSDVDVDEASHRLGFRLRGTHLALVLRAEENDLDSGASLDATLRWLAAVTGVTGLSIRVDIRTTWCWLPAQMDKEQLLSPPTAPVLVALGRPAIGLDGFRRSHREALEALRVAEMAQRPAPTVTYYRDVDVAALCSIVPERCHEFVQNELGELSGDDRTTRRLRETLKQFYAANSNFRATAANLGIHHNTVRYRLGQAEQALGRPVGERRLELELALHLADTVGVPHRQNTGSGSL